MKKLLQAVFWTTYPVVSAVPLAHFAGITVPPEFINPADNFAVFMTWWLVLAGGIALVVALTTASKKTKDRMLAYRPGFVEAYCSPIALIILLMVYVTLGNWWMAAGTVFYVVCDGMLKEVVKELRAAQ